MDIKKINCWIITEGMIGTQNQCLGVAEALSVEAQIKTISLNQPWKTFTPWLGFEQKFTFKEPLNPPWPDLVIASGRKAVAASRYIKKKSNGKTFTVQIQDPKCNPKDFDLVAVPHHDSLRSDNLIVTDGAPNRITPEKLQRAKEEFSDLFTALPSPRTAVLIGGNSRTHKMTPTIMQQLVEQLKKLDGGLMITASRRTGEDNLKLLQDGLKDNKYSPSLREGSEEGLKSDLNNKSKHPHLNPPPQGGGNIFIWDGIGKNPYHAMLAWADHILVTSDSVSMISDAATTGKPTQIINLEGQSKRFDRFHNHMEEIGATRPFKGNLEHFKYAPIDDADKIAKAIKEAMQKMYG